MFYDLKGLVLVHRSTFSRVRSPKHQPFHHCRRTLAVVLCRDQLGTWLLVEPHHRSTPSTMQSPKRQQLHHKQRMWAVGRCQGRQPLLLVSSRRCKGCPQCLFRLELAKQYLHVRLIKKGLWESHCFCSIFFHLLILLPWRWNAVLCEEGVSIAHLVVDVDLSVSRCLWRIALTREVSHP